MCFSIFLPIDFQSGAANKATPAQPARLVLPLAQKAIAGPDGLTAAKGVCRGVPHVWGSSASPGLCEGTGGAANPPPGVSAGGADPAPVTGVLSLREVTPVGIRPSAPRVVFN